MREFPDLFPYDMQRLAAVHSDCHRQRQVLQIGEGGRFEALTKCADVAHVVRGAGWQNHVISPARALPRNASGFALHGLQFELHKVGQRVRYVVQSAAQDAPAHLGVQRVMHGDEGRSGDGSSDLHIGSPADAPAALRRLNFIYLRGSAAASYKALALLPGTTERPCVSANRPSDFIRDGAPAPFEATPPHQMRIVI